MLKFSSFLLEKKAQGGFDYEDATNARLKSAGLQSATQRSAGSSANAPDGTIEKNNQKHGLEIKQNKNAMMGQIELHHNGQQWVVSPNSKQKYPKTAEHIEKHFLPDVNQKWGKPSGDYETDKKMGNVYKTVSGTDAIKAHYGQDRKTPYIQIGGSGLHHTSHDSANLGTSELNGNTQFRARMKYRKTDPKTGKVGYGALVVMNLRDHKPSHINLDKDEDVSKLQQS